MSDTVSLVFDKRVRPGSARRWIAVVSVFGAFLMASTACSSSPSSSTSGGPTTTVVGADAGGETASDFTDATESSSQWSTDTSIPSGDGLYLLASWEIEIGDLLRSDPDAPTGIPEGVICEGKIRLTIMVDGTFTQTGKPKCEQDHQLRNAEIKSSGTWRIADHLIEFSKIENKGQIYLVKGVDPFTPGLREGVAKFEITGDTLDLTVESGTGRPVVTRWTYADPV